ncbi:endolytic transglycosylase MltG [bacterium]|nr:MAG: endolytic transglycosylase MltG [bacterium]
MLRTIKAGFALLYSALLLSPVAILDNIMKSVKKTFANFLIVLVALIVIGVVLVSIPYSVLYKDTSKVIDATIVIPKGCSVQNTARLLTENRIINRPNLFVLWAKLLGFDRRIRAGRHRLVGSYSLLGLLQTLSRGGSFSIDITVYDGENIYEIAGVVEHKLGIDSLSFLDRATNDSLMKAVGIPSTTAEGFLFPETYNIDPGTSADELIAMMYHQFKQEFKSNLYARAESLGMSIKDVVTLASIIEKEAYFPDEMPRISGVYHNRLSRGMLLQACPTVNYALKQFDKRLLYEDLELESPYNTYKYKGLPPTPIANPGKKAILAALYPEKHDFYYFVSEGEGHHSFTRTEKEHAEAIRAIKKRKGNLR